MIELPVDEPTNVSVKSVGLLYLWESLVDLLIPGTKGLHYYVI